MMKAFLKLMNYIKVLFIVNLTYFEIFVAEILINTGLPISCSFHS